VIIGIQLLRFLAAFFVVLTHVLSMYPDLKQFGGFGVDVFFIISGFIIYVITDNDYKSFFVKRLIRIVPMYWLFTIGISIIAYYFPYLLRSASFDLYHITASLLFIPYWTENTGFAPILTLGWTLNFEILFYLIFFAALKISHKHRAIIASILICLIVMSLNFFNFYGQLSALNFYSSTIWFEFIFGIFMGLLYKKRLIFRIGGRGFVFLSLTSLATMTYLQLNSLTIVPRFIQFGVPSFVLVFTFLAFEDTFVKLCNILSRIILWLGEISYPLYLTHVYIIALIHRVLFKEIHFIFLLIFALVISSIVSHFVNLVFDKPIRKNLNSKLK
jgi:exopolysaccharide production protein ExoZ